MLEIVHELIRWVEQGRDFAIATVVAVDGSAPRGPGAALAVDSTGEAIGSVSGGCIEATVYEMCMQALRERVTVLEGFGYSDADAFAVGLSCGGSIDVLVTPVATDTRNRGVVAAALSAAARGEAVALARVAQGPARLLGTAILVRPDGSYDGGLGGSPELDRAVAREAHALLEAGRTDMLAISEHGSRCADDLTLFVESSVPAPRLIVVGAIDFASALTRVGKFLGYHVTVCDARPVFATRARFPDADEIEVDWPHRYLERTQTDARTVLCVLTHDAKFDIPLLRTALRLPLAYIGAMGSRRTHDDRNRRLREAGVTEEQLGRLHSPIGLDLGGRTPEETALSIAAEIVASRRGGSGLPLATSLAPIHREVERRPQEAQEQREGSAEATPRAHPAVADASNAAVTALVPTYPLPNHSARGSYSGLRLPLVV